MSNAIIRQGENSRVADNVWEFHIPENFDLEPLLRWLTEAGVTPGDVVEAAPELVKSLAPTTTRSRSALPLVAGLVMGVGGAAALNAWRRRDTSSLSRAGTPTDWPIKLAD